MSSNTDGAHGEESTTAIVHERCPSADGDLNVPLTKGNRSKPRSAFVVVIVACIAAFQFGYNTAVMSGALHPVLKTFWPCYDASSESGLSDISSLSGSLLLSPLSDSSLSSSSCDGPSSFMEGLLVSLILVGALIGALCGGPIADRLGRLFSLVIDEALFLVGAILCAFAPGPVMFLFGRIVLGLGVGIASTVPSMYATEIAPLHERGQVGVVNQVMICGGIFFAYLICALFNLMDDHTVAWRLMVGAPIVIAVVHWALLLVPLFRVESPRYLVLKGQTNKARDMMKILRGNTFDESEFQDVVAAASGDKKSTEHGDTEAGPVEDEHTALYEAFHPVRPILIATGLQFFQQITGINAVLYYLSKFFMAAGMDAALAGYMSIVVGAVNIIMTFVTIPLIDRLGRKPLLLISLSGMTVTLGIIGFVGLFATLSTAVGVVNVIITALFVVSFAVGMGCCPWAVINEIFNNKARGVAVSLSMATNWSVNLLVTLLFPVLIEAMNMGYVFIGFAVFGIVAIVFVAVLLPETKGRSMEDIVAEFKK